MTTAERQRPHVLFPLQTFLDSQTEYIDRFIPEFKQLEDSTININNIKQLDDLLSHLELSFLRDTDDGLESFCYNLRIPSVNILRILFTLASRCTASNSTHTSAMIDGLVTTNQQIRAFYEEYSQRIHKTPLRDRSVLLLNKYLQIVVKSLQAAGSNSSFVQLPLASILYDRLTAVLKDFLVREAVSHKRKPSLTSPISIKRHNQKDPQSPVKQYTIDSFFQVSPKTIKTTQTSSSPKIMEKNDDSEVSDSEEEEELKLSSSTAEIENEINRFQSYNISPTNRFMNTIFNDVQTSGMNNAGALFLSFDDNGVKSYKKKKSPGARATLRASTPLSDQWHNLKVFEEDILSKKLNPRANSHFNLWKLMNWAFFCADRSSKCQTLLHDSSSTTYHSIYNTYRDLLEVIVGILEINFIDCLIRGPVGELLEGQDPLKSFFSSTRKHIVLQVLEESPSILLLLLMTQLGKSQSDWWDRIVEFVFNGLGIKSQELPVSCYEREKDLIRHDNKKETFNTPFTEGFYVYSDNYDSMRIRFRIICLTYYWSLFFLEGPDVEEDPYLNSNILLKELSRKFVDVDFRYLIEFFRALGDDSNQIPRKYQYLMLGQLANTMLLELTTILEPDRFRIQRKVWEDKNDDDSWWLMVVEELLEVINDERIYLPLVASETDRSFGDFTQLWMKVNYLLEWLLDIHFERLQELEIISHRIKDKFSTRCRTADELRSRLYQKFIRQSLESGDPGLSAELKICNPSANFVDIHYNRFGGTL